MKRKILLTIPLATLAGLAIPTIAQAHTASASGTCQGGVQWSVTNYDKTVTNSIVVAIDGNTVHTDPDFKASDTGTIATDKTKAHVWTVTVNAPGTQWDRNLSGSYGACETSPTTTTVAPTTTSVAVDVDTPVTTTTVDRATPPVNQPTTTTVVAVAPPPVPSTVVLAPPAGVAVEPVLPVTGAGDEVAFIVTLAVGFIAFGVYLVLRGRRVP